jgi:environmental stress-induced protein Ves
MKPIILSSQQFTPRPWSGGKTTELFIYPSSSQYAARDFDFRLSTATVAVESSIFTPLEQISRTLMVLDGEMTLSHLGQHSKTCGKFDVDTFDGGWTTSSVGKCTDFNLMTRGKSSGTLEGLLIKNGQTHGLSNKKAPCHLFIYVSRGEVSIKVNEMSNTISTGDLYVINEFQNTAMKIHGMETSELVICKVTSLMGIEHE